MKKKAVGESSSGSEAHAQYLAIRDKQNTLLSLCAPVMEYIANNYDPHTKVEIDMNSATVFCEEMGVVSNEFIE